MNPRSPSSAPVTDHYRLVMADILSQAVTGELVGMQNFASLVALCDGVDEKIEAVEHANNELSHAIAFRGAAAELGVTLIVDLAAPYWQRIRAAFLEWAERRDLVACTLIQEVMLESFAVSMYQSVGDVAQGRLAQTFRAIAAEEQSHLEHALEMLRNEHKQDPEAFLAKVHAIHEDVMTVLAEMVAKEDTIEHCGLCSGTCVKDSLHHVKLNVVALRGQALRFYLKALDRIGLPGERTLQWVANLPL